MESARTSRREEINKNFEITLNLLRSTKPDATDLLLNMINDSIVKKYGNSKTLIDTTKYTKLRPEENIENETKPMNKITGDITSEENTEESCEELIINEMYDTTNEKSVEPLKNQNEKTKSASKKNKKTNNSLNNHISKPHKANSSKIKKNIHEINEKNKKYKTVDYTENFKFTSDKCDDDSLCNISETISKAKSVNFKYNTNLISQDKHNESSNQNNENLNGNHETEIQNLENIPLKRGNEHFGLPHMVKRINTPPTKPKVRSHKKPALHELSSRQRIQAILKKGINVK